MPSALGQARVFSTALLIWEGCDVPKHHKFDFTIVGTSTTSIHAVTANKKLYLATSMLQSQLFITSSFFPSFFHSVPQVGEATKPLTRLIPFPFLFSFPSP
jgi:hypothetical protein